MNHLINKDITEERFIHIYENEIKCLYLYM